ncbi:hypothetical protein GJ654_10575 [Rhodoblastus acidophilus]|uniref:Flagellar hook-length control protein-like C-terminal domain-containing protein n=2 Tax=Rhodoblastus acidophilus TaxID=1074 RepID=A0A6N8DLT9_RHOAC|nr:flagellar hook-length control protein FliK [Rhodoblastus acidophilus]MCW2274977.1 flagellar hook-length control protein FliK [Rhodoblastus acidophilus]MTV31439.1 hypothetical protein [Rhodoblastus acidophilus]
MVQDAGGALALSRKTSRDDLADVAAFDAALAQTADEADLSMSSADLGGAGTSATAGGDGAASCLSQLLVQDFAPKASSLAAGDRLVSRIAVAWLDATAAPASVSVQAGQSDAPTLASTALTTASTTAEAQAPATPLATASAVSPALLAGAVGQGKAAATAQPTQAPANAAIAAQPASPVPAVDAPAKISATTSRQDPVAQLNPPRPQSDIFDAAIAPAQAPANGTDARDSDLGSDASAPPSSAPDPSATVAISTPVQVPDPTVVAAQPVFTPPQAAAQIAQAFASPAPAASLASAPATTSASDSVARIGAALSSAARTRADATPAAQEPETTSVHVVAQQSWLPPVDPRLSGGAPSHSYSGKNSGSAPGENAPNEKGQGAEPLLSFAQAAPANLTTAAPPSSASGAGPVQASASSASTQLRDLPSAPTPAVRRDLEITLTPQDLGGLQVKLKSSGDRLELSFVADRGETARMISDKSAALESQLHDAGIGLGGVAISSSAAGMSGDAPSGGAQGGQEPSAQTSGSSFGAAGGQEEPETTRQRRNFSGREPQDSTNEPSEVSRDARGSVGARGLYL